MKNTLVRMFLSVMLIVALFFMPATPLTPASPAVQDVYGQTDARFLDSPAPINNPASWNGAAWYCIDGYWPNAYIVAGPFPTRPNCNGY